MKKILKKNLLLAVQCWLISFWRKNCISLASLDVSYVWWAQLALFYMLHRKKISNLLKNYGTLQQSQVYKVVPSNCIPLLSYACSLWHVLIVRRFSFSGYWYNLHDFRDLVPHAHPFS